jgi:hypothetical protein
MAAATGSIFGMNCMNFLLRIEVFNGCRNAGDGLSCIPGGILVPRHYAAFC